MSEGNGNGSVIKIGRKGFRDFQFGDGPVIRLDVVRVNDDVAQIDAEYRDAEGNLKPEASIDYSDRLEKYVKGLILGCAPRERQREAQDLADSLSMAEVLEFLKLVRDEVKKLKDFFAPASRDAPSSAESTEILIST